ncbi:hypothetical protein [Sinorhizobium fredii]|uniref:hypothetical protein n=1 Tax=Rhizobium fredii TaxID=380 RepID=UPI0004B3258B|nr:hypothetical protein [Sinorhizobium fredii]
MILTCNQCGRKGRYNVARLIEKHGADMTIRDFIAAIGSTRHRWVNQAERRGCGLGCDDLVYMFMPKPTADLHAESVQQ